MEAVSNPGEQLCFFVFSRATIPWGWKALIYVNLHTVLYNDVFICERRDLFVFARYMIRRLYLYDVDETAVELGEGRPKNI